MEIKGHKVKFHSTGRKKYAHKGIIGLSPEGNITEGYDGGFHRPKEDWESDEDYEGLTIEECFELTEYMIERWQERLNVLAKTNAEKDR